jgi:CelD/BcsL family acetyltransferase involved in cellulose biosynthesis
MSDAHACRGQRVDGCWGFDCPLSGTSRRARRRSPEWLALEYAAGAHLPFQTWEWCLAWWKHLHEDSLGVRDHLRVCVIRNGSGEVIGIAPLILTERPAFGPLRVRYLQLIGADPNITEIRTMLCQPGFEQRCYKALCDHLALRSDEWDWVAWEEPVGPRASDDAVDRRLYRSETRSAFVLGLHPSWGSMKTSLRRNIRQSLRKCYNSLRRDGLTCSLEIVDQPDAVSAALGDFFRLHSLRANLRSTTRHIDVFESAVARVSDRGKPTSCRARHRQSL